jgi:hypothetical protein
VHRLRSNTYVGEPAEVVSLTTTVDGGGQIKVTLDGRDLGGAKSFTLPPASGGQATLQIALAGPLGAACVVEIKTVDGGSDGDLLLCQALTPAPVHLYSFSVAGAVAVNALAGVRGLSPSGPGPAPTKRPSTKTTKKTRGKK